jgi:hypothetical protein
VSGRLFALGDSFSCGEGVGMRTPVADTWVGLLAAAMQLEVDRLAVPGMNAAEPGLHPPWLLPGLQGAEIAATTGANRTATSARHAAH